MTATAYNVFIVDDDPIALFHWGGILRAAGHPVQAFERPEALLERLSPNDRGCVVMDLRMPGLNGLELQRELVAREVLLPSIFASGSADVPAAVAAMKGGAVDFLSKPVNAEELRAVVARALEKDAEIALERARCEQTRARWAALTARETAVCRLVARGHIDKQIAAELGTKLSTVQFQRTSAMRKLGVTSVVEVVRLLERST